MHFLYRKCIKRRKNKDFSYTHIVNVRISFDKKKNYTKVQFLYEYKHSIFELSIIQYTIYKKCIFLLQYKMLKMLENINPFAEKDCNMNDNGQQFTRVSRSESASQNVREPLLFSAR